ncbi:MAG: RidA family protein [Anaerolineae bacterium]|nr:RidA family protein [Anaerolineae bacterium]
MERQNISSGAPWEATVGYSRAVRVGAQVWVAGTTAVDEHGQTVCPGDAYGQTKYILQKIGQALEEAGTELDNVVRTRMFVTKIEDWVEIGRAHGEFFATVRPAATLVEVSRLISPDLLVEIEVDAFITRA